MERRHVGHWSVGLKMPRHGSPPRPIPQEERENFINEVTEAFEQGTFPKLKASIYFNSLYAIISPLEVKITQMGDIAHGKKLTEFPNSPELVPVFTKHLQCKPFAENDKRYGAAILDAGHAVYSGIAGGITYVGSWVAS